MSAGQNKRVFVPNNSFQATLIFVGKAKSLPEWEPFSALLRGRLGLVHKHSVWLKKIGRDERSSLFLAAVSEAEKKFFK